MDVAVAEERRGSGSRITAASASASAAVLD
jgi:hypothetical protein